MRAIISPVKDSTAVLTVIRCANCQKDFETNVKTRLYCSTRCQRQAKAARHKERDANEPLKDRTLFEASKRLDCDYIENPTVEIIVATSNGIERLLKRATIFYGDVPDVDLGMLNPRVEYVKQEDNTWLMLA